MKSFGAVLKGAVVAAAALLFVVGATRCGANPIMSAVDYLDSLRRVVGTPLIIMVEVSVVLIEAAILWRALPVRLSRAALVSVAANGASAAGGMLLGRLVPIPIDERGLLPFYMWALPLLFAIVVEGLIVWVMNPKVRPARCWATTAIMNCITYPAAVAAIWLCVYFRSRISWI